MDQKEHGEDTRLDAQRQLLPIVMILSDHIEEHKEEERFSDVRSSEEMQI